MLEYCKCTNYCTNAQAGISSDKCQSSSKSSTQEGILNTQLRAMLPTSLCHFKLMARLLISRHVPAVSICAGIHRLATCEPASIELYLGSVLHLALQCDVFLGHTPSLEEKSGKEQTQNKAAFQRRRAASNSPQLQLATA